MKKIKTHKTQFRKKEREELVKMINNANVYSVIYYDIECCICCEEDKVELYDNSAETIRKTVKEFYDLGWRYENSKKCQVIGHMCKKCHNTPDEQRGE